MTFWFSRPQKPLPKAQPSPALGVGCLGRITPGQRVLRLTFPAETLVGTLQVKRQESVKAGTILALGNGYALAAADLERAGQDVAVSRSLLGQLEAGEKADDLKAQEAVVARDQAEAATRKQALVRTEALFAQGIVAQSVLDEARLQSHSAERTLESDRHRFAGLREIRPIDLAAARHRLQAAEASLKVAEARVELNVLRAPFDGQVLAIHTYPGEAPGASGVLDFAQTSALQVEAEVHVEDIARVRLGSVARLSCEGLPGELTGTVTEIAPVLNSASMFDTNPVVSNDVRVISVRIQVPDGEALRTRINAQVIVRILP